MWRKIQRPTPISSQQETPIYTENEARCESENGGFGQGKGIHPIYGQRKALVKL